MTRPKFVKYENKVEMSYKPCYFLHCWARKCCNAELTETCKQKEERLEKKRETMRMGEENKKSEQGLYTNLPPSPLQLNEHLVPMVV